MGSHALAGLIQPFAMALELFGVALIVATVIVATVKYLVRLRSVATGEAYHRYRASLGRGILLGLEVLIGADIIATVTAPLTWNSVGLLAAIVLIRTFLSFSLETEIEGSLPWRRTGRRDGDSG